MLTTVKKRNGPTDVGADFMKHLPQILCIPVHCHPGQLSLKEGGNLKFHHINTVIRPFCGGSVTVRRAAAQNDSRTREQSEWPEFGSLSLGQRSGLGKASLF